MIILITGIPGTGKTEIGNYLEDKHGFAHIDVEKILSMPNLWNLIENAINNAKRDFKNLVITWGFMPDQDKDKILKLKEMGAKLIWFDGNRPAARKAFLRRGTVSEDILNIQMSRIEKTDIVNIFHPIIFNTFKDNEDVFLSKQEIAKNLLKLL